MDCEEDCAESGDENSDDDMEVSLSTDYKVKSRYS